MLELLKKNQDYSNIDLKKEIKSMQKELFVIQQKLKEKNIPLIILLDGMSAAGKGSMMGKISARMEPRGYKILTISKDTVKDLRPEMYNYWLTIPSKGDTGIYDEAWYNKAVELKYNKDEKADNYINEINTFERQLTDDGYLIVKFFLHISKEEQKKRLLELDEDKVNTWKVTGKDWDEHEAFEKIIKVRNEILKETNTDYSNWNVIFNERKDEGVYTLLKVLLEKVNSVLENPSLLKIENKNCKNHNEEEFELIEMQKLQSVDVSKEISDKEFKKEYKKEKEKIKKLHSLLYKRKIPMVIAFEGWDAAGKGGAIRRLSWSLDTRGFNVYSIAAPSKEELSKHYLYRFWNKIPKKGHISMYDRSWYGRVMVERVEGFTKEDRWQKAYTEINEFEKSLTDFGAIVLKFFIHIDKNTQLERFTDRQNNPEKQFKITDEDWRNREKWDAYEVAIDEMLHKTSTVKAPWIIIEGNNKPYARLKVLKTVRKAMEERLK